MNRPTEQLRQHQERIAADVDAYLKRGGKVYQAHQGETSDKQVNPLRRYESTRKA